MCVYLYGCKCVSWAVKRKKTQCNNNNNDTTYIIDVEIAFLRMTLSVGEQYSLRVETGGGGEGGTLSLGSGTSEGH